MTIRKGEDWGRVEMVSQVVTAQGDGELASLVKCESEALEVRSGDTWASVGGPGPICPPTRVLQLPFDAVEVIFNAKSHVAYSSVVVRSPWRRGGWLRGQLWLVSLTGVYRARNVAPRAHPNDGRIDVIHCDASMSLRDRCQAWRRALVGDHLPHRHVSVARVPDASVSSRRDVVVVIDGRRIGTTQSVQMRVLVDEWLLSIPYSEDGAIPNA